MSHLPNNTVCSNMWMQLMYRWYEIKRLITKEILNRICKLFKLRQQIEQEKKLLRERLTNQQTRKDFLRHCKNIRFYSKIEEPEVEMLDLILLEEIKQVSTLRTALRPGKFKNAIECYSEDDFVLHRNEVDKIMDGIIASVKRYIASVVRHQNIIAADGAARVERLAKTRDVMTETSTDDESDVEEIEQCRMLSQEEDFNDVSFGSFNKRAKMDDDDENKKDSRSKEVNKDNEDNKDDEGDKGDTKEKENVEGAHAKQADDDVNDDNDAHADIDENVEETNDEGVDEARNAGDYSVEGDNSDSFKFDNFEDNTADNDGDEGDDYIKEYNVCGISPADLISILLDSEQVAGNDNEEHNAANGDTIETSFTTEDASTVEVAAVFATSDINESSSDETNVLHIDIHCPDCGKFIVTQKSHDKHESDTDDTCSTCGNKVSSAYDSADVRVASLLRERVEKLEGMREPGDDITLAEVYIKNEINPKSFFENDIEWIFLGPSGTKVRKSVIQNIDWNTMKSSEIINELLEILIDEKTLATHNVLGIAPANYPEGVEILKLPEKPLEDLLYLLFMAKGFTPRNGVKVINKKCDEFFWKKHNDIFLKPKRNLYDENENKIVNGKSESESEDD